MSAPRPAKPITPAGRLSGHELQRLAKQAAQGNRLTVAPPLRLQQGNSGSHVSLDTSWEPFLARLTNVVSGTGEQAGLWLYGFVEQDFDPATGLPKDATNGRSADPTASPLTSYAQEINNQQMSGLGKTSVTTPLPVFPSPLPSPLPYSYVEMRLKGVVNGSPFYEFELPDLDSAWVRILDNLKHLIVVGRQITDGVLTDDSKTLNSNTANFTSADVGCIVTGAGIPTPRFVDDATLNSTTLTSLSANFTTDDVGKTLYGNGYVGTPTITAVTSSTTVTISSGPSLPLVGVTIQIGDVTVIASVTSSSSATLDTAATLSASDVTISIQADSSAGALYGYAAVIDSWDASGAWIDGVSLVWCLPANEQTAAVGPRSICKFLGRDASGISIWGSDITTFAAYFSGPGGVTQIPAYGNTPTVLTSVILPVAGTYLITAFASGGYAPSANSTGGHLGIILRDKTGGVYLTADVSYVAGSVSDSEGKQHGSLGCATSTVIYTTAGDGTTIELWAENYDDPNDTSFVNQRGLTYIQLAGGDCFGWKQGSGGFTGSLGG